MQKKLDVILQDIIANGGTLPLEEETALNTLQQPLPMNRTRGYGNPYGGAYVGGRMSKNCLQYYPYNTYMSQEMQKRRGDWTRFPAGSDQRKQARRTAFSQVARSWSGTPQGQARAQQRAAYRQQFKARWAQAKGYGRGYGFVGGRIPSQCQTAYHQFIRTWWNNYWSAHPGQVLAPGQFEQLSKQAASEWLRSPQADNSIFAQKRRENARIKRLAKKVGPPPPVTTGTTSRRINPNFQIVFDTIASASGEYNGPDIVTFLNEYMRDNQGNLPAPEDAVQQFEFWLSTQQ